MTPAPRARRCIPTAAGNALVDPVAAAEPALFVTKNVNSAFYGDPDLHAWLQEQGIRELVICGIQTNMCVETTARMAGNLGYDVDGRARRDAHVRSDGGCRGPRHRDAHGRGAHGDDGARAAGGRLRPDRDDGLARGLSGESRTRHRRA